MLTHHKISKLTQPGKYADGKGLHLRVYPGGTKAFVVRVSAKGGAQDITLGSFPEVGLSEARKAAKAKKAAVKAGLDAPAKITPKRAAKATTTFGDCVAAYVESHRTEWTAKHTSGWAQTMAVYAEPVIGHLPPAAVTVEHVMEILAPIWTEKAETATRVRARIEAVLDWAVVRKMRGGENCARWDGHLQHLLPDRAKVAPVAHRQAMPFADVPDFCARLSGSNDHAAPALLYTILTAARSGEARGATWGEVDLCAGEWVIPPARMKAGREHRVPLCDRVAAVVAAARVSGGSGDLVFPGARAGRPLSGMAFPRLLQDMGHPTLTTHGFRSSFRDWVAEKTTHAPEVAEMALAHAVANKVEAAYRRGNLLEKRRPLMEDWATYCFSGGV